MSDIDFFQDPEMIQRILIDYRRVAVVGLSPHPERPSHRVSAYMKEAGYEIVPVNPGHDEILGEKSYKSLLSLPSAPQVVNVFRRSKFVAEIVEQAIFTGSKAIWLQVGVVDQEAAHRACEAGLSVVMDL